MVQAVSPCLARYTMGRLSLMRSHNGFPDIRLLSPQLQHGSFDDPLDRKSEFLLQNFQWGRRSERRHPNHAAGRADIVCPSKCRGLFDRDTSRYRWRQHMVAIRSVLLFEELPRGHTHDPGLDTIDL